MVQTEKEPPVDFNNLEQVTQKYLALKALVDLCPCEQSGSSKEQDSSFGHDHSVSDAPVKSRYAFKKMPASLGKFSVQDIAELEKHRLSIWLAKFVVVLMALIIVVVLCSTAYFAVSSKTRPDATLLGAIFANLNDIVLAVLNAGKVP